MLASIVDRASDLLKEVNLLYGVVSGLMLKYSFEWSAEKRTFHTGRSWMALGLAVGALVFSAVLLVLLGDVALDTLRNDGAIEPTLVILDLVTVVMLVLAAASVAAIVVAVKHLLEIRNPSG
jgi:hypothetical protein